MAVFHDGVTAIQNAKIFSSEEGIASGILGKLRAGNPLPIDFHFSLCRYDIEANNELSNHPG
jgi:hypothetical protein